MGTSKTDSGILKSKNIRTSYFIFPEFTNHVHCRKEKLSHHKKCNPSPNRKLVKTKFLTNYVHSPLIMDTGGESESRENTTEVLISILENVQKHRKVNYIDLPNRQTMHVPREICCVSNTKATCCKTTYMLFTKTPSVPRCL